MHPKKKTASYIIVGCVLLILLVSPMLFSTVNAQTADSYYITINPRRDESLFYTAAGRNLTLSFEAYWTCGSDAGQLIDDATTTIEVTSKNGTLLDTLEENTTTGVFLFTYSSPNGAILTFNPTKIVTQDGTEWNSTLLDKANKVYGLASKPITVWWDTFQVQILNQTTNTPGITTATVNVTYLLIPEEGLTLLPIPNYQEQKFLPKPAYKVNVTINGVEAQETEPGGVYSADISTWSPTGYILVGVSKEGWQTTYYGFSFAHSANQPIWTAALLAVTGAVFAVLLFKFALFKKQENTLPKNSHFPFLSGILMAAASAVSLYWGLEGLNGALNGFDWMPLTLFALFSSVIGFLGALMATKKKAQAFAILTIILPLTVNLVMVKTSLEAYQLAVPWSILIASLTMSMAGGFLICNSDGQFRK